MRKLILAGWMCTVAATATAFAEGTPKIKFDTLVYDFGATSMVEVVTGKFVFENAGDSVLELQEPKPSCGCTVAKVSALKLQPGEKGELEFHINLGPFPQKLAKHIFVSSNDPKQPVVDLTLKAEVQKVCEAVPPSLSFGSMRLGTTTNCVVVLKRIDGRKLPFTRVEANNEALSAQIEPLENTDGLQARVRVSVKADGLPRRLSDQVRVFTADSKGPAMIFFVSGRFIGDLQLDPEALVWGMPDPEHWNEKDPDVILTRSIIITATKTDQPLKVSNVTSNLKGLTVKLETIEKGKQYQLNATLAKRQTQPSKGTISFQTNLASLPKIEIPIEINIWKK